MPTITISHFLNKFLLSKPFVGICRNLQETNTIYDARKKLIILLRFSRYVYKYCKETLSLSLLGVKGLPTLITIKKSEFLFPQHTPSNSNLCLTREKLNLRFFFQTCSNDHHCKLLQLTTARQGSHSLHSRRHRQVKKQEGKEKGKLRVQISIMYIVYMPFKYLFQLFSFVSRANPPALLISLIMLTVSQSSVYSYPISFAFLNTLRMPRSHFNLYVFKISEGCPYLPCCIRVCMQGIVASVKHGLDFGAPYLETGYLYWSTFLKIGVYSECMKAL